MEKMTNEYYFSKLIYIEKVIDKYHHEMGTSSKVMSAPFKAWLGILIMYEIFPSQEMKTAVIFLLCVIGVCTLFMLTLLTKNSKHYNNRKAEAEELLEKYYLAKQFDKESFEEKLNEKLGIHLPNRI